MGIAFRIAAIVCTIAGVAGAVQSAAARERRIGPRIGPRPVSEARFGLIGSRTPRMGPLLVLRGGYTPVADMVRPRFVGGVVDIYPSTKLGFRFSAGTRYFARSNFWIAAEQATNGILYDPHMTRGGRGLVRSFRRYTPVALVGYDISPANGLVLGIEGGAMTGRAIPTVRTPRLGLSSGGYGRDAGMNGVVTLSARLAF